MSCAFTFSVPFRQRFLYTLVSV